MEDSYGYKGREVLSDRPISIHEADFGLHTKIVLLAADHTLDQSSTTLQNVTNLKYAIGANEVWAFILIMFLDGSATPDFKYGFTMPSGGNVECVASNRDAGNTSQNISYSITQGSGALTIRLIGAPFLNNHTRGIIINGGTAGDFQLQAAQNSSDASDVKVKANSYILLTQLS